MLTIPNFQHKTGTKTKLIYIVFHKLLEEFLQTFMKIDLGQDKDLISVSDLGLILKVTATLKLLN